MVMTMELLAVYLPMKIGKQMQFFGARANLQKHYYMQLTVVLMKNIKHKLDHTWQPITSEYLDYDEVMENYDEMMEWLC